MRTELKIGGVPEHFNLPWHLAIEKREFEKNDIILSWKDYSGGTGAMCKDLRNGSLDIAIVLTEGIIADIIKGNPGKIIKLYVKSPLIWGIHVPANSSFSDISQIKGKRYAISRLGSGSHLMAFVDAKMRGWDIGEEQLVIVNNLDGAREAFKNNKADIFMWEKFTTKPLVDSGEFRRIGERETLWPCFAIAVRDEILEKFPSQIKKIQEIINNSCKEFMSDPDAINLAASRYQLQKEDVDKWFRATQWSTDNIVEKKMLEQVIDTLLELKLVDKKVKPSSLCSDNSQLA